MLLVILVVLGGYFFYRSLPNSDDVVVPGDSGALAAPDTDATAMKTLYIRVTGESSDVLVRIPGGKVLLDTTMVRGQHVSYAEPKMDVTLGEPSAVEVYVNGDPRDVSGEESGYTFTAVAE